MPNRTSVVIQKSDENAEGTWTNVYSFHDLGRDSARDLVSEAALAVLSVEGKANKYRSAHYVRD